MKKDKTLHECDKKEIEELLLGHKIVADESTDSLLLDNGVLLYINPNVGCGGCTSGNYYLEHIRSVNNAITNVEFVEEYDDNNYHYKHYKIFVIADGLTTELLDVYGTDGNGYYGTGYTIDVCIPDED
ncbi:MAG: hypothetical protein EGR23_06430 [Holdemanella biformis]|nr:hypothetical protein [Holdemanella biformis]